LASIASSLVFDTDKQYTVGLEINANHLKSVKNGLVKGITRPIHIGKKTQVWEIKIFSEKEELTCISRITITVLDKN